jgi:sodium transport system ATP-binding protein
MIEAVDLQKQFGTRLVLNAVSFVAHDREITGILGANGAGKTTILRMISGALMPSGGDARIDGAAIRTDSYGAQMKLGSLLDHTGIYSRLTPRENLMYFARLRQVPSEVIEQRVDDIIDGLGLGRLADTPTGGFSQGERMKVALGRVLVHQPMNLVLDEPTNGLDIPSIRNLRDSLKKMRNEGRCIVFSSHILEEIQTLCDRVVILGAGKVVAEGTVAEVCSRTSTSTLEEAFMHATLVEEQL